MDPKEVVLAFMAAWEEPDFDAMQTYLADDFKLTGVSPQPLDKRWMIADTKARWSAFPDWTYNFRVVGMQGNVVQGVSRVSGTHTGTLIPPVPGMPPIPPTGKRVSLPEETCFVTVRNTQIVEYRVEKNANYEGSGYTLILKQLGVEIPG